jgi:predicted ATP-grasp superfamily ATP-dependent carboligase
MKSHQPGQSDSGFVLLGFAEALSSPEVAWSLVDAGFRVAAFARKGRKSALHHSRYVTVLEITAPETDYARTCADLVAILSNCRANEDTADFVLFPLDDVALWLCAQQSLSSKWVVAGPSAAGMQLALDKAVQVEAAIQARLPVLPTIIAKTRHEILTHVGEFPLLLKPAKAVIPTDSYVRKGSNWICANRRELERALAQWNEGYPLLVQPYVTGVGVGVFGFAREHGVECWSAHRRLRMMNPHGSGSSACVSRAVPKHLKQAIERMILRNGWRGLFMVEFLQDHSGEYWFIEFNGRPWGSMALSRRQGLEYPAWNAMLALAPGFSVQAPALNGSELVCRNLGRDLVHLLFVLRGRKSRAIQTWPSFWRSVADVLYIRRRDCFYNLRRDDLRVFFSDCFCTIRDQIFKRKNREQKA